MSTQDDDEVKNLELALEEQRRDYNVVNGMYDSIKLKAVTFLGADLAILLFLYGTTPSNLALKEKLFIPNQAYGIVIYALAASLFLVATCALLLSLRPKRWSTAFDNDQEEILLKQSYKSYLTYMQKRYRRCSMINNASYQNKQSLVDMALPLMLIGAILLVTIKTFGG